MEVMLPYLFYKANTALQLQPDQEVTRKSNVRLRFLMNVDEIIFNRYEESKDSSVMRRLYTVANESCPSEECKTVQSWKSTMKSAIPTE